MTLQFLTLEMIKRHLHIDSDDYDQELELYAASAEEEALNYMERTYESLIEEHGKVPVPIIKACLMRVGTAFRYREDITDRTLYRVPYAWEGILIRYKPKTKI